MEKEIEQLVEMVHCLLYRYMTLVLTGFQGATRAQARAALQQHKDVMEAAERIFEGKFDHVADDDDVQMAAEPSTSTKRPRMAVRSV